jgi:hypothetical protein
VERTISLTLNRIRLWPSSVGNETPMAFALQQTVKIITAHQNAVTWSYN